jgi:hypothetical protein
MLQLSGGRAVPSKSSEGSNSSRSASESQSLAIPRAWFLSMLAWTYGLDQRFVEAEDTMQDATDAIGELQEEPIVAWTRADILRMAGADSPTLESAWRTAVDSSRSKGMRIFEFRSTVGLARLLKRQGRSDEARAMLTDVYNWFTEGFDIADLQDAKKLLDELA